MRACAFGLVLFSRLLLFIFTISSLICSIVIVFADSLVGAVGGEVEFSTGLHPLMEDVIHLMVDDEC